MFLDVHAAHALDFGPADVGEDPRSSTISSRQIEAMMRRLNLTRVDIFVFEIYKDSHCLDAGDAVVDSGDHRIECRRCLIVYLIRGSGGEPDDQERRVHCITKTKQDG